MKDTHSSENLLKRIDELPSESDRLKQALEAAEDLVFKYENFLENMEDRYFEVDLKGNFKFANKVFRDRLNIKPCEIQDTNYREFGKQNVNNLLLKKFNQIYKTGIPQRIRWEGPPTTDGKNSYMEILVFLMKNRNGEPIGFQAIA